MSDAASALAVTNHVIRRLIKDHILPAEQVVPGAPYQFVPRTSTTPQLAMPSPGKEVRVTQILQTRSQCLQALMRGAQ